MKSLHEYDYPELWEKVRGIDCDGPESRQYLEQLFLGELSRDEACECLANLSRDYEASTAGIAAVPLLLLRKAPDAYLAHLIANWTGVILTNLPPEAEIPEFLRAHIGPEFASLAAKRMLETAGAGEFTATDVLAFCETLLALKDEKQLAERISMVLEDELRRRVEESNRLGRQTIVQTTCRVSGSMTGSD